MNKRRICLIGVLLTLCLLATMLVACNGGGGEPKKDGVSIYFVSHGGSRVETITARPGSPITPPADPVRDGYYFVGWYLTQKAAEAHSTTPETLPTVMPSKSVTYHAGWSDQGAQILLDANGGELAETRLSVAIGAKLSELMRQYTPVTEEGVVFDGWFKDGVLIDDSMIVTGSGISLQARYSAYYVVNIFKQGLDGQEALDQSESLNELVPVGTQRTYVYKQYDGFKRTSDAQNSSRSLTVGMHAADNRIDVHYARLRVKVHFLRGADGAQGEESGREMNFGEELILPQNPFTYERHRFAGWRIGANIFEEGAQVPEESMAVTDGERVDVVAVWDERFDDIGGGVDVLWLLGADGVSLELSREDLPLMTGRLGSSDVFSVRTEQGRTLRGKLMRDEGLFTWDLGFGTYVVRYVASHDGTGAPHPDDHANLGDPADSELYLGGETIKGSYRFSDADGVYIFTSDEDTPRQILFSVVEIDGTRYFVIRENLSCSYSYTDSDGNYFEVVMLENGSVELYKGVKKPYWLYRERISGGSYVREGENFKLSVAGNPLDGKTVKVQSYGRTLILYDAAYDGTFDIVGGGKLKLDGFSGAVYTEGDVSESGEFYVIGGEVVFFGQTHCLRLRRAAAGFAKDGDFEDYRLLVSSDGAESIVINGHGSLRYVDYRGRTYYESYSSEDFDGERTVLKFSVDAADFYYLVDRDGVATPTGAEVGTYVRGGAKLRLDGLGGAVYEEGGQSYDCTYAVRSDAPYDYQLDGEQSFRFILIGNVFRKHDAAKYGEFIDKFDSSVTLFLDGYGAAELREGGVVTAYDLADTDGFDISLTSPTDGELKLRLLRKEGATSGSFVRYDAGRDISVNKYDASYFDEEGTNLDYDAFLTMDGYDGVTIADDGRRTGSINSISSDGVYDLTLDDGASLSVKLFSYEPASTDVKLVFACYDARYKLSLSAGASRLETDGYGILTYAPAEGEPIVSYYAVWGNIITAKGGGFGDTIAYFSLSGASFERCTGLVIDGVVVKRYIGEGGDVSLPNEVSQIAENAFKGSAVQSVVANRLDGGIGDSAFEGCVQLERIVAPSVSSIGARAFFGCERLQEFSGAENTLQTVGDGAFAGCVSLATMSLQAARYLGVEAFAGDSVAVTLGAQNLSGLTICDRAFAHGDDVAPQIVWTSDSSETPVLQGDPFAFDGEGKDLFTILVSKESQLGVLYNDAGWSKYAGYICFANVNAPEIGEYFSIASLNKIKFEKITIFDNRRWTYNVSESGAQTFITYDGMLPDRTLKLTVNVDLQANVVKMYDSSGNLRYGFVEDGASLEYASEDGKILSFAVSESDVISAVFDGTAVQMTRKEKTFDIGDYTYTATLFADGTFAYSSAYRRQLEGTYRNGSSEIGLYKTNAEGTKYILDGDSLLVEDVDGATLQLQFADISMTFESITPANNTQINTQLYFFVVASETTAYTVMVELTKEGTYFAKATIRYRGSSYNMSASSSRFEGRLIVYSDEVDGVLSYVRALINYGGKSYDLTSFLSASGTVTFGEDCPPDIRGTYQLRRTQFEATLTKVS